MAKMWKGRFTKSATQSANEFNASIQFDQRFYAQDIQGSTAHARMLAKQGILTADEAEAITSTLAAIKEDIEDGKIEFTIENEDIHMNIEAVLTERIGDTGKKLHTARSRNDQVAVDFRLYMRQEIDLIIALVEKLKEALYKIAEGNQETIMPGYTHLQRAQPVTLAHYMLAYYQMFSRDASRLTDCRKRLNQLPLGSGALAGTTYNTDRDFLAKELDFDGICPNSIDAVSDRDFALEFLSDASILMMHLSRFCEELIIWNSTEFGFIDMDDAFSTGSSIMPQKKNPDMAELIRGKTGRVYGDMITLFTLMKSLPLAYNKDMQEDKPPVFDAVDTLKASIGIFTEMISTITFNKDTMRAAVKNGFMNATDAADYLVRKGIPFRDCHEIIGRIVLHCVNNNTAIEDIPLETLREFSDKFDEDIYENITAEACVNAKKSKGSTSFASVREQLETIKNSK
ncbi:MAG: argininosuccinate lyase [Clostridiales bacterium]|nr:argininosuccinate lyase [Clostridiales bacterium]